MEAIDIAVEYKNEIEKIINDMTLVLYGSTVYGVNTSDLDLCFVRNSELDESKLKELIEFTKDFHLKYNLRIDEEVPYESKLIYTNSFIENCFCKLPFPYINGKYEIPAIEKTKEFLKSEEMKKRLLLNILTVKRLVLSGDEKIINSYSKKAWEKMLKVVISYSEKIGFTFDDIMSSLYADPFQKNDGEMYLGYKTNLEEKKIYLANEVEEQLDNLVHEEKLVRTLKRGYIADKRWLNS